MACKGDCSSKREAALMEGLVWACIAFILSWVIFIVLCLLDSSCGVELNLIKTLFYPVGVMTDYLSVKGILSRDNWPGGMLLCYVAPWMVIGFIIGALRGFCFGASGLSVNRGCLLTSFYVVLAVLAVVILILVF